MDELKDPFEKTDPFFHNLRLLGSAKVATPAQATCDPTCFESSGGVHSTNFFLSKSWWVRNAPKNPGCIEVGLQLMGTRFAFDMNYVEL